MKSKNSSAHNAPGNRTSPGSLNCAMEGIRMNIRPYIRISRPEYLPIPGKTIAPPP